MTRIERMHEPLQPHCHPERSAQRDDAAVIPSGARSAKSRDLHSVVASIARPTS